MKREIERFDVRADDGRTWRFTKLVEQTAFKPLMGGTETLDGGYEYESLDESGRWELRERGGDRFTVIDFQSDDNDVLVTRVRGFAA